MAFSPATEKIDKWTVVRLHTLWHRFPAFDAAMIVIGKWTPIVMLTLIFLASTGLGIVSDNIDILVGHAATAVVAAVMGRLGNYVIAKLIERPRPFERYGFVPLLHHERGGSFPSNHATGALALSMSMLAIPGYGWLLLTLAVLLCISRVYTGLHHLTDVAAGAINGVFWAAFCLLLYAVYIPYGIGTS